MDSVRPVTFDTFARCSNVDRNLFSDAIHKLQIKPVDSVYVYRIADLLRCLDYIRQQGQIAGGYADLHRAINDHIDRENAKAEAETNAEQKEFMFDENESQDSSPEQEKRKGTPRTGCGFKGYAREAVEAYVKCFPQYITRPKTVSDGLAKCKITRDDGRPFPPSTVGDVLRDIRKRLAEQKEAVS